MPFFSRKPAIFIIHPHNDLFSNPTVLFILKNLIDQKIKIILFIYNAPNNVDKKILNNIDLHILPLFYPTTPRRPLRFLLKTLVPYINCKFLLLKHKISNIICVDPEGVVITSKIYPRLKRLYNYISFELFFLDEIKDFRTRKNKVREISVLQNEINSLLIQDKYRLKLFMEENNPFKIDKIFFMPVAPVMKNAENSMLERLKFNPIQNKKTIIYSGSIHKWSGLFELIENMEKNWNNEFHLVIHNRFQDNLNSSEIIEIKSYINKGLPISLINLQLEYDDYLLFLKQFDVGLATYIANTSTHHYDGKNFGEIGYSSGKFNTYMMIGLPTITTKNNSFNDLYKTYNFGYIINDFSEMNAALSYISKNYDFQKNETKRLYKEIMNPELYIHPYINHLIGKSIENKQC